jgi:hypothetical protein
MLQRFWCRPLHINTHFFLQLYVVYILLGKDNNVRSIFYIKSMLVMLPLSGQNNQLKVKKNTPPVLVIRFPQGMDTNVWHAHPATCFSKQSSWSWVLNTLAWCDPSDLAHPPWEAWPDPSPPSTCMAMRTIISSVISVRDQVDHWAKNICRFQFPDAWFIFNLHRRIFSFYIKHTHTLCIKMFIHEQFR